ncbi:hypothetical protein RJ639_005519 [Escallonia herrerae]|uniref:CG-1 domain-containing protein n=1 Tax=Escallonia herrerae TaxID=1293975 RepID=A0AA89AUG3_9ASTE|nr:hypothetical protein RJ639_005519 [Escallonia herrerae]
MVPVPWADLDVSNIQEEAKTRWLRPNEIHAILCNHKIFSIHVKPVNLPKSGTIVLFDRKMLRNFRKDGHNWKKKKDGKTVKEAHEHLKVGNDERIHVYYAHGHDAPTFVRRCYWLLDRTLEHIVLVHYRETQEVGLWVLQSRLSLPVLVQAPLIRLLLGFFQKNLILGLIGRITRARNAGYQFMNLIDRNKSIFTIFREVVLLNLLLCGKSAEPNDSMSVNTHQMRLHEINTLEWDELLVSGDHNKLTEPEGGSELDDFFMELGAQNLIIIFMCKFILALVENGSLLQGNSQSVHKVPANSSFTNRPEQMVGSNSIPFNVLDNACFQTVGGPTDMVTVGPADSLEIPTTDALRTQDSFGRWINYIMTDSPKPVVDPTLEPSISTGHESFTSPVSDHPALDKIFSITDVSPAWALSTEETKILVIGFFQDGHPQLAKSNLFCVCGDACVPVEVVQPGVFRCLVLPRKAGVIKLYMSFDGYNPISQVLDFEFRTPENCNSLLQSKDKWEEFRVQMRLAHLLFSTSKSLNIFSSRASPNALKEAKVFTQKTLHIVDSWAYLIKSIEDNSVSFSHAKDSLFELALQNRLQEWLLERVVEGRKISDHDDQGQGVIHLCSILGYTWAIYPFSWSGLSLDYRDKYGWTALHWAAYYGREKMVAALLSAGAKPNLVTDPTPENPGGCTAADVAYMGGHEGLAAYLAEKGLVEHFKDMTIAGNVSGSLQTSTTEAVNPGNLTKEELYLKDTLAAYRTAADVAARIQSAFREQSLKLKTKAIQSLNPGDEACNIIAAMKIQHAFRNYDTRKKMAAAVRIQHRFHAWKIRKDYLSMRRQAIKIQAIFRGFQVRRQYRKIVWSVGVVEKAILRWRLKRKGFRGYRGNPSEDDKRPNPETAVEEDFFRASRKQAEDRVERSVVRVQAMFRSRRAQEEYRRMKFAHEEAKAIYFTLILSLFLGCLFLFLFWEQRVSDDCVLQLEYEGFRNPDIDMR